MIRYFCLFGQRCQEKMELLLMVSLPLANNFIRYYQVRQSPLQRDMIVPVSTM